MADTYCEHDELLKYEYTLASCYEAEYLLSLKLQEGMIYDSSSDYYDVFEIHYPNCTAAQQVNAAGGGQQPGAEASGGSSPSCEVDSSDCGPVSGSMETGEIAAINAQPHLDQTTANGWLFSDNDHQPSKLGGSPLNPCQVAKAKPAAVQNGQEIDPNLHDEGPSRKRICLHHH